jgi:hypothetical protein
MILFHVVLSEIHPRRNTFPNRKELIETIDKTYAEYSIVLWESVKVQGGEEMNILTYLLTYSWS